LDHALADVQKRRGQFLQVASGDSYLSFMSFAASITLPPPSAMIWSAL
jgi:hypothetical protein